MNSEEIKKEMIKIDKDEEDRVFGFGIEKWHVDADRLLIKVLRDLGYDELCDWWENGKKWYA